MEMDDQIYVQVYWPPGEKGVIHWKGGWVGPRTSLGVLKKCLSLPEFE